MGPGGDQHRGSGESAGVQGGDRRRKAVRGDVVRIAFRAIGIHDLGDCSVAEKVSWDGHV